MRHVAMHTNNHRELSVPRGWIVVGAALASWLVVAIFWSGMSQIFGMLTSLI